MARAKRTSELVLHPVRLRIIQALLGGRELTTGQLDAELGDVASATLYRQVATLSDAGVLEVVAERRVRGAVERTYRLRTEAATIAAEDLERMGIDEHRQAFASFAAALLADFDAYLEGGGVDLARDGVTYRQVGLWLSAEELLDLLYEIRAAFAARADLGPAPGRTLRRISTIAMPAGERDQSQS